MSAYAIVLPRLSEGKNPDDSHSQKEREDKEGGGGWREEGRKRQRDTLAKCNVVRTGQSYISAG